jgi:hypothetical protein
MYLKMNTSLWLLNLLCADTTEGTKTNWALHLSFDAEFMLAPNCRSLTGKASLSKPELKLDGFRVEETRTRDRVTLSQQQVSFEVDLREG